MENYNALTDLIKFIETNKHDVTMRVRSVVLDPIQAMNRPGATTDSYNREIGLRGEDIKNLALDIMSFFAKKWRNPNDSAEQQLLSIRKNLADVSSIIIPKIKQVVTFYTYCSSKKYLFSDTDKGNKALEKMTMSVSSCQRVCESLLRLEGENAEHHENKQICNLLEILQEGLDSIEAEVNYVKEWETSRISVSIDPEIFLNHVLINVKENINTHAFGTNTFRQKYVWEKKVCIEVQDGDSQISILVHNNGEPFKGDITKVFEYGYCHGEKKHSGIGMHSIKKSMTELGGDVEFKKSSKPDYTTTYKLVLKK